MPETRTCARCAQNFEVRSEDASYYEKTQVPLPTFCSDCRAKRRMLFWNQHNLFRKEEALNGKEIFSSFPPDSPVKIYDRDYWWSDAWDPLAYGKDADFGKPFLAQIRDLFFEVPYGSRSVINLVRSDYCDQAADFKDCYLCFNGQHAEECLYGVSFFEMRNCVDFHGANGCEMCYGIFSIGRSYRTSFATESVDCRDCMFLENCSNLSDCLGCVNLGSKQFHIFNQPYSKEEYQKKLEELDLGSYARLMDFKKKFEEFRLKFPCKYSHVGHVNNVVGEYVYNSKNAYRCYEALNLENVAYVQSIGKGAKDSYDFTNWGENTELVYESAICGGNSRNLKFCVECWGGARDMEYCINCPSSSNCFGCVGLRKKQYCVLNKQYSKEEYEALVPKLKIHMRDMPYRDKAGRTYAYGEFFPEEFAPFAYNESSAQDYYPLNKEQAEKFGYSWRDQEEREYAITMEPGSLPDHIRDAKDDILKEIIRCKDCGRAYRILAAELEFYRRLGVPLPRACYRCRYKEIMFRNPLDWHHGKCMCAGTNSKNGIYPNAVPHPHGSAPCANEFESSYAPDRPEIIYCEQCYQLEVA